MSGSSEEEAEWNDDEQEEEDPADANDDDDVEDNGDEDHEEEEEDGNDDEEEEDDDGDFEDEETPTSKKTKAKETEEEESDSDDEDDDMPLTALIKPKKSAKKSETTKKRKSAATTTKKNGSSTKKKKPAATKKKPPPATAAKKKSSKSFEWASAALYGSECDKGLLIQRLLCRWWYAYQWPEEETLQAKPPPNYDSLDGFKGVYIATKGDDVGKILDTRNPDTAPCFVTFAKKSAAELRDLLITALQEQARQLQEAAPDPAMEKELKSMQKWATKLNSKEADKDAAKILKAHRLSLS